MKLVDGFRIIGGMVEVPQMWPRRTNDPKALEYTTSEDIDKINWIHPMYTMDGNRAVPTEEYENALYEEIVGYISSPPLPKTDQKEDVK